MILSVKILIQYIVVHPLGEFLIFENAVLDKRADIIPVLLIIFPFCLVHAGQLVRNLPGDIIGDLLGKAVILKCRSGYVQRQIRAVNDAFEHKQILRDHLFDIIRDEYLTVVELDFSFDGLILAVDSREIENALQVERILHIQMDPEKRLLVIIEDRSVKFLIVLILTLGRLSDPQRIGIVDRNRTLFDLNLILCGL